MLDQPTAATQPPPSATLPAPPPPPARDKYDFPVKKAATVPMLPGPAANQRPLDKKLNEMLAELEKDPAHPVSVDLPAWLFKERRQPSSTPLNHQVMRDMLVRWRKAWRDTLPKAKQETFRPQTVTRTGEESASDWDYPGIEGLTLFLSWIGPLPESESDPNA